MEGGLRRRGVWTEQQNPGAISKLPCTSAKGKPGITPTTGKQTGEATKNNCDNRPTIAGAAESLQRRNANATR
ncbi:hypothetical protein OAG56_05700 [Mariniblastus sp.]|nr:hypothetical protein [Mariniblastus sp.]